MSSSLQITDLPPEILEVIFSYLQLNLQGLLELAMVCRAFRNVVYRVPIPVKIPVQDKCLEVLRHHQIPALALCNREPSLFVKYQVGQLNLRRLVSAQLVANDYLAKTNKVDLSPHYVEILEHLSRFSHKTLRHLMVNVDLMLMPGSKDKFRCADIITRFKNLTFLALHFTQQIELQQRILGLNSAQGLIQDIVSQLKKLKMLYIFVCPTRNLVIHSESLEKLCIYKSEFVRIEDIRTPKLKSLMFHNGLGEFFRKAREDREMGVKFLNGGLFRLIYNGCPNLDFFNTVYIGVLRQHDLSQEEWSQICP